MGSVGYSGTKITDSVFCLLNESKLQPFIPIIKASQSMFQLTFLYPWSASYFKPCSLLLEVDAFVTD